MQRFKHLFLSLILAIVMVFFLLQTARTMPLLAGEADPCTAADAASAPECAAEVAGEPTALERLQQRLLPAQTQTPEEALAEAYDRVVAAESYDFVAESEQTLIPRPVPEMIGQSQQQVDLYVQGEVTLPDQSLMSLSLEGPGLDSTPSTILQEGVKSYLLRDGEKIPVENPAGLTSPNGDYLSYLVAAENVQPCALVAPPFATAVACYTYDINGPAYAEHVRQQMAPQIANTPGAAAVVDQFDVSPLISNISGSGKVWLDAHGLPLRQKIDMFMPEADPKYDADVLLVVDYQFDATAVAAVQASESLLASFPLPLPTAAEVAHTVTTTLPQFYVTLIFVAFAVMLVLFARRRWMYRFIAVVVILSLVATPMLQSINMNLFYTHRAYAAADAKTFAETFIVQPEAAAAAPAAAPAESPWTQPLSVSSYEPSVYCGQGGNGDRDGDGLADDAENCLGTNPNMWDSDGDGISDGAEVAGFEFGTQTWYTDPTVMDTNMDGVSDGMEWSQEHGGLAANWDLDEDGIPNVYDTDDDGDGVRDSKDISPASYTAFFDKSVSVPIPPLETTVPPFTFPIFNPFYNPFAPEPEITETETISAPIGLNITGQYNGYVYVDLQVQPKDLEHLRYGVTPLDWGYDDEGQIQEHNDAPDEDIQLVPMLVVESNVAPSDELAEGYHLTPYKDLDNDGYGELMMPLYRVGEGGTIEAFHARMAYGPDSLADLGEDGVHWRNMRIIWMVRGTFDKESEDGTLTQQSLSLHTYEEPAARITGWEVTKSGPFESAIFGTPEFQNDDRALFQLAFGLNEIYLDNPQIELDEINARFSGANTPAAQKWGITTTLAIDLPVESYSHTDAGVADINNRIKSFVSDHYSFDTPNTVLVAYESHSGSSNLDDFAGLGADFSGTININSISMRKQRTLQLNMRDGLDPINNGAMALAVMKRVQPAVKGAMADLGSIYPDITEVDLVSLTQALYTTWESGRTRILSLDGVSFAGEPRTDQSVYEQIFLSPRDRYGNPELISTLPGYLIEVGKLAQRGSGLVLASGQVWPYLQSNVQEAATLGITVATATFVNKAADAILLGLDGQVTFGDDVVWTDLEGDAENSFFNEDNFGVIKTHIGNAMSVFSLVDTGMTLVSAAADAISATAKATKAVAKAAKFITTVGDFMGYAALAIDIGLAVTMFFMAGDFSMQAIAMLIAQIVVAVVMFVLGTIPPWIGTVISVVLAIFDLILTFCDACSEFLGIDSISGWVSENLADYFYREVQLTELDDYSFLERNNTLADEEMGFVVGNRFVITDTFQGVIKVSGTPGINWNRIKNAAIYGGSIGATVMIWDQIDLIGRIFGGPSDKENLKNSWICGEFVIKNDLNATGNTCPDKNVDYDLDSIPKDADYWMYENPMHTTIPLNIAQHNFTIMLSTKVTAQTRWDASTPIPPVFWGFSPGRIHWTKERKLRLPDDLDSDNKSQWSTTPIYIDVLPATVEEFWNWGQKETILINRDPDGDGMSTKDEVNAFLGSNSYASLKNYLSPYFSEIDEGGLDRTLALWDHLEMTVPDIINGYCAAYPHHAHVCNPNETVPWLTWDFDQDGLSDKFEYDNNGSLGTDAFKYDTDGDGLSDGFEFDLGTRIDKVDSDGDGLTDATEVYHPTAAGSWGGGWDIELPQYGAVGPNGRFTFNARVFSDPLIKDTDGDGLSDYAEKENGTSPRAFNRAPKVTLAAQPTAVAPWGVSAVYVKPGDLITMTSRLDVYPPYTVSTQLELDIPGSSFGFAQTGDLNGSRWVPVTGGTATPRWSFSNNVLQPWEYLHTKTTGYAAYVSHSTVSTATLTLPFGGENQVQEATQMIVVDVENPRFQWMTPSDGELIGGGVTHFVVGGTSGDQTTWVDELTLFMPGETVMVTDTESFSPWAYTWELPSDGIYTLRGRSRDYVGHTSSEDAVEVMVDNTAPSVDVDLQDGAVFGPPRDSDVITITLNGSATENYSGLTRVQISTDGGPWREVWTLETATVTNTTFTDFSSNFFDRATAATWDAVWTLPNVETVQGYHSLRIRAFDQAGNWPTYLEREIIIDVQPPTDELVNNAYLYEFPHLVAGEPHTFDGIANDVGNVPAPSRPVELAGDVDGLEDATILLGLDNIHDDDGGVNVAWAGDFNGDRRGDLLVGLPAAADGAGRVAVIYGRSGDWAVPNEQEMLTTAQSSFIGLSGAGIGEHLMPAGDVNGDGHADILVGDPANNRAFLIWGRPLPYGNDKVLAGAEGANWSVIVPPAGQNIGDVLGAAGDVNGDGFADLLIGGTGSQDVAYLLLGQANPWWPTLPLETMAAGRIQNGGTGMLAGLGDLDGDFYDEFAVGVNGRLYIYAGRAGFAAQANSYYALSSAVDYRVSADETPQAVALGDVNGDHIDDFIYNNGGSQVLVYGDANLNDGTWTTHNYNYGSAFLSAPGDVDNDGLNDILIVAGGNGYFIAGSDVYAAQATIGGVSAAGSSPYAAGADLNSDGSSDLLFVPDAVSSAAAAEASTDSIASLPPTWVPQLPEQSLDTFTGDTTWSTVGMGNVHVSSDGDCHGMTPCYTTIQAAVDNHLYNAFISVHPGVYDSFIIDGDAHNHDGIYIKGTDPDAVIIDGGGSSYAIRVNNADFVRLENMTIRNASYGVQLDRVGVGGHENTALRAQLTRVLIYDTGTHDIYMTRDSTVSVIDSTLSRSSNHVGAYGAADSSIVVEWAQVANAYTPWPITDGGGAVRVDNVIYANRGGGSNQFARYYIDNRQWIDPWGPNNSYEADSVIAAGSDDHVYLLGAPTWKEARAGATYFDLAESPTGALYAADHSSNPYVWNGFGWSALPVPPLGSSPCYTIAAHPETGELYCLDYTTNIIQKWDGSWSTFWEADENTTYYLGWGNVRDMIVDKDGEVHVVGDFFITYNLGNSTCYDYAANSGSGWSCSGSFTGDDSVLTIAYDANRDTIYVGGTFRNEDSRNIAMMPGTWFDGGLTDTVTDISVGDDGTVYVSGHFTSTFTSSWNVGLETPAGIASYNSGSWTTYPEVVADAFLSWGYQVAALPDGEFYAAGLWDDLSPEGRVSIAHWNGNSWDELATVHNVSNNASVQDIVANGRGIFFHGNFTSIESSAGTLTADRGAVLQFPHEVYSTTMNSWQSDLVGPPMPLGDGASYAGDDNGKLVLLPGGGRTATYVYDIETAAWTRAGDMLAPVNASAMVKGEDGYIYAVTDGPDTFYRFTGHSWQAEGPSLSGAAIDDGATLAYDTQFGTYYLLPGGNGTKMFRYNSAWGSSWVELPADRNSPAGIRPGAGLIFVEGEEENYLYTAQGNYIGDNSQAFWEYPLPRPNKIDFTDSIIYAQNATNWLNLSDPLPEDFNFRVDENSLFFGGTGWTPNNMRTLPTTTADPFLDAARDLYRMGEAGADVTIGYHTYHEPVTATTSTGIQAMIDTGANRVIVEPGIYEESVYLVNGVEVIGTNPDWTMIKPLNGSGAPALVRAMGSNGASFSRFTLDGEDSGLDGFAATQATNLTLQRARIYDTDTAIALDGAETDVEVAHVTAANNQNGLVATNCASLDMRNSIFAYHSGVGLSHEACAANELHTYNLFWANASDFGGDADAGAAELFLDPSFVDPMDHDYRTLNFSPVIDAGNPTDPAPPGAGSRADIGYIEQGRINFYVDDSYCAICTNDGLTWQVDAFDTIQDALNAAAYALANLNPGMADVPQLVVGVAPGTYNEQVSVPSHVLLFGSGAETTILDAGGSGTAVTFNAVTNAGVRHLTIMNGDTGILVSGAANMVDLERNIIRQNTVGVAVNGRATAQMEFNTLVNNGTGVSTDGPGSWLALMHNIISGSSAGAVAANNAQIFSDYNLYNNTLDFNGPEAGDNDRLGQNPLFAGGEHPYRLSETSPALDAASGEADVPQGGGLRADLGYSELLAPPLSLLLGQEDLSTVMGNSGVASVEYGVVKVEDPDSPVTSTLPLTWTEVTLDTPGETLSYWSQDYTPAEEGFYRFYSRATDMVGNAEEDEEVWYEGSFVVDSTAPVVTWLSPAADATLEAPLELRAQVDDYAAGEFSVDENDVYFEVDGTRYPATWAAEPWDEAAGEPRVFRAWVELTTGGYVSVTAGAEDKAGNVTFDDTLSFIVSDQAPADVDPPMVTVSLPVPGSFVTHTVSFSGTATDAGSGIASVELSLDGGATWRPTVVDGDGWSLVWEGPEEMPMISYPAKVRATDHAGHSAVTAFEFSIDEIAPTGLIPVTFSHPEESHFDSITDLTISWQPAIDASGQVTTFLTVDQITDTIAIDVVEGLTATHALDASGEWYVHLSAIDAAGNMMAQHFGPWHVGLTDGSFASRQQSIIIDGYVDVDANEWRLDTEYLDDDERTFGSEVTYSPGGQQSFLTTWDANNTFIAWRGGHWALDGELWIYINSSGGGSNVMIQPLASSPSATLPFDADYAIRITDPVSGTLYEFGDGWQPSAAEWAFAQGSSGDTEIRLPLLGTANLETLAFGLGDDHNVWAIFPATNPLVPVVADPIAGLDGVAGDGGWGSYSFPDVTAIESVADGQPVAVGLALQMEAVQAATAPWGPGSTLQFQVEVFNMETDTLVGEQILFNATPETLLVHDRIDGATCSTTNPWDCTLDPLQPGVNVITLTVQLAADLSGHNGVMLNVALTNPNIPPEMAITDSVTYKLDGTPPTVTVESIPFVTTGSQTFVGTASDGDGVGVAYVEVKPQYGSWQRADGTDLWTVDLTVSPFVQHGDSWQFEVRAVDHHGQTSDPVLVTTTVDFEGPSVSLDSPLQLTGSVNEIMGTITEVPHSSQAAEVQVQVDDEPWQPAILFAVDETTGEQPFLWTWNLPTEDGAEHTIRVQTVDLVGNTGALAPDQTVWIDNVTPALTVTQAISEVAVQHYYPGAPIGDPVLAGTVTDGSGVAAVDIWVELPNGQSYVDTADLNGDAWEYIPELEALGSYKLQVRPRDMLGNQTQTEYYLMEVKAAPESGPNSFITPEDTPISFEPLLDDIDIDSESIYLDAVQDPENGTAVISGTSLLVYTPTLNFNGTEVFTYTATDGQFFDTAAVTVTVLPVNDPPVINAAEMITRTMDEDGGALSFSFDAIEVDGDTVSWQIDPGMGTAEITRTYGTGDTQIDVAFTPEADFAGIDSFRVQLSDGEYEDEITVAITVNAVDDAPRAADDYRFVVTENISTTMSLDVLANDEEVDGQQLLLTSIGAPSGSGAAIIDNDRIIYTPTLALQESETITYTISDGGLTDTATVHLAYVPGEVAVQPGETAVATSVGISDTIDVELTVPANVYSGAEQVTFVLRETEAPDGAPETFKFAGISFVLDAYVDGVLTPEFVLDNPITLDIRYSDADVAGVGTGDDQLTLFGWDGAVWLPEAAALVNREPEQNLLVVTVDELHEFILFGKDMMNLFLPMITN